MVNYHVTLLESEFAMIKKWSVTIPKLSGRTPRNAYVYVPDAWKEDHSQRYPVLYMFDGHNVFFDEDATYGKSWGMLDYLEETQTPIIVAAVECSHAADYGRLKEYCPFRRCEMDGVGRLCGKGKETMDWFVKVFKKYVDNHFPTLPDREHTFIAGSSMGGLMSLYAVTRYNRYFSRAAALSPSVWFANDQMDKLLRTASIGEDTVIYMDYGGEELANHPGMTKRFRTVTDLLLQRNVDLTSRIVPNGNHSEASWERQIPFFMNILLYGVD